MYDQCHVMKHTQHTHKYQHTTPTIFYYYLDKHYPPQRGTYRECNNNNKHS